MQQIKDEVVHSWKHYQVENRTIIRMMDGKDCRLRIHYTTKYYRGHTVLKPCRCLSIKPNKFGDKRYNLWRYNHR